MSLFHIEPIYYLVCNVSEIPKEYMHKTFMLKFKFSHLLSGEQTIISAISLEEYENGENFSWHQPFTENSLIRICLVDTSDEEVSVLNLLGFKVVEEKRNIVKTHIMIAKNESFSVILQKIKFSED